MTAERLFIQGNVYARKQKRIFRFARYGNVLGLPRQRRPVIF